MAEISTQLVTDQEIEESDVNIGLEREVDLGLPLVSDFDSADDALGFIDFVKESDPEMHQAMKDSGYISEIRSKLGLPEEKPETPLPAGPLTVGSKHREKSSAAVNKLLQTLNTMNLPLATVTDVVYGDKSFMDSMQETIDSMMSFNVDKMNQRVDKAPNSFDKAKEKGFIPWSEFSRGEKVRAIMRLPGGSIPAASYLAVSEMFDLKSNKPQDLSISRAVKTLMPAEGAAFAADNALDPWSWAELTAYFVMGGFGGPVGASLASGGLASWFARKAVKIRRSSEKIGKAAKGSLLSTREVTGDVTSWLKKHGAPSANITPEQLKKALESKQITMINDPITPREPIFPRNPDGTFKYPESVSSHGSTSAANERRRLEIVGGEKADEYNGYIDKTTKEVDHDLKVMSDDQEMTDGALSQNISEAVEDSSKQVYEMNAGLYDDVKASVGGQFIDHEVKVLAKDRTGLIKRTEAFDSKFQTELGELEASINSIDEIIASPSIHKALIWEIEQVRRTGGNIERVVDRIRNLGKDAFVLKDVDKGAVSATALDTALDLKRDLYIKTRDMLHRNLGEKLEAKFSAEYIENVADKSSRAVKEARAKKKTKDFMSELLKSNENISEFLDIYKTLPASLRRGSDLVDEGSYAELTKKSGGIERLLKVVDYPRKQLDLEERARKRMQMAPLAREVMDVEKLGPKIPVHGDPNSMAGPLGDYIRAHTIRKSIVFKKKVSGTGVLTDTMDIDYAQTKVNLEKNIKSNKDIERVFNFDHGFLASNDVFMQSNFNGKAPYINMRNLLDTGFYLGDKIPTGLSITSVGEGIKEVSGLVFGKASEAAKGIPGAGKLFTESKLGKEVRKFTPEQRVAGLEQEAKGFLSSAEKLTRTQERIGKGAFARQAGARLSGPERESKVPKRVKSPDQKSIREDAFLKNRLNKQIREFRSGRGKTIK